MSSFANPIVSVVIPCYNYGEFLEEAIDSCLNSTFRDMEIIVVNDGSTDPHTIRVLKTLNKPKTSVIHQENKGVSAARNFGIHSSRGKYILPLDSDDKIASTLIEKEYKILEDKPNIGFVTHWAQTFGDDNTILKFPFFDEKTLLLNNIVINTSLFRKVAWADVLGYDQKLLGFEDWDFWISLIRAGWEGYTLPEVLFYYRRHGQTKNNKDLQNWSICLEQIRKKHSALYDKYGL